MKGGENVFGISCPGRDVQLYSGNDTMPAAEQSVGGSVSVFTFSFRVAGVSILCGCFGPLSSPHTSSSAASSPGVSRK